MAAGRGGGRRSRFGRERFRWLFQREPNQKGRPLPEGGLVADLATNLAEKSGCARQSHSEPSSGLPAAEEGVEEMPPFGGGHPSAVVVNSPSKR